MTEETSTSNAAYVTTLSGMIPFPAVANNVQFPTTGEEYVLWGFMHDHNSSQSSQLKFMPLYRVLPSYEKTVTSSYNHSEIQHHLTGRTKLHSQALSISVTPSLPLRPPVIHASKEPALHNASGALISTTTPHDDSSRYDRPQRHERSSRSPYSPEITRCLKRAFINTVGQNQKLTKALRERIMQETGLSSRRLTYWFSNRKRRPPFLGKQFQKAVIQSCGQVKTYEDFELWGGSL